MRQHQVVEVQVELELMVQVPMVHLEEMVQQIQLQEVLSLMLEVVVEAQEILDQVMVEKVEQVVAE
jgi:hypothetical protein